MTVKLGGRGYASSRYCSHLQVGTTGGSADVRRGPGWVQTVNSREVAPRQNQLDAADARRVLTPGVLAVA